MLPILLERRWRAVAGFALGAAVLIAGSMAVVGIQPWIDFAHAVGTIHSSGTYRDNSIQSLLINLARIVGLPAQSASLLAGSTILSSSAFAGVLLLGLRKDARVLFCRTAEADLVEGVLPFALVAMLIASPLVWEHHWVFVQLPMVLMISVAWGTRFQVPALLAYALIFGVPTFDSFPVSYHRLAGLIWAAFIVKGMVAHHGQAPRAPLGAPQAHTLA